jgi:hypothetical protein
MTDPSLFGLLEPRRHRRESARRTNGPRPLCWDRLQQLAIQRRQGRLQFPKPRPGSSGHGFVAGSATRQKSCSPAYGPVSPWYPVRVGSWIRWSGVNDTGPRVLQLLRGDRLRPGLDGLRLCDLGDQALIVGCGMLLAVERA